MLLRAAGLASVPMFVVLLSATQPLLFRQFDTPAEADVEPPVEIRRPAEPEPPAPEPVPKLIASTPRVAERVNDLRPCVRARLARVVEQLPDNVTLIITSAHRTREEQAALVPTFGVKAAPGTSTHEDGRAIDVNVLVDGERVSPRLNQQIIGTVMSREGFQYLGPRDPVHYSVPKWEIDPQVVHGPEFDLMTYEELLDRQASRD